MQNFSQCTNQLPHTKDSTEISRGELSVDNLRLGKNLILQNGIKRKLYKSGIIFFEHYEIVSYLLGKMFNLFTFVTYIFLYLQITLKIICHEKIFIIICV